VQKNGKGLIGAGGYKVRIISGEARGRKLKGIRGMETRPTADRVKEALFSILAPVLSGAKFLDLFAGTGSIGMEAISRGAAICVFVDNREICTRIIRENLALCGFSDRAQVRRSDALLYLKQAAERKEQFDLIFVDPPYDAGLVESSLSLIAKGDILSEDGLLVVEARKNSLEGNLTVGGLVARRQAIYGDTMLTFFCKAEMMKGDSY
jgi:16S rRNA (guanine966-N2)-methyltransferase